MSAEKSKGTIDTIPANEVVQSTEIFQGSEKQNCDQEAVED